MSEMKFKTTINCGSCIRLVTPELDGEQAIDSWKVDTDNPDKILTVTGNVGQAKVIELVKEAGFEISPL